MLPIRPLNPDEKSPLFRQLHEQVKGLIDSGVLPRGTRLPATRELAGQLGLNRTTVSAAYALLESEGLIAGHVGRGSFVTGGAKAAADAAPSASFSRSRPSELLFPLEEFRKSCAEVIASDDAASILQLGSPAGYAPLRRYLLEEARAEGTARDGDDILITSGCQQAFDLLQRTIGEGATVAIEDPVYLGVRSVFERAGARLIGVPVGRDGIDLGTLERLIARERPRLLCVTPNFQNPTGATMPPAARQQLLRIAQDAGVTVIENDIYGPLCYAGEPVPSIKQLDETGDTVLLRSFSKVAFPGLRVGWVIARRALIEKLTEAKQWSDLHTDQLSQAVLLRFAESGRLEEHRQHMLVAGRERLEAALEACARLLAGGREIHAATRRDEFVDRTAGDAGRRGIAGARRTRGRDVSAWQVLRGVAAAAERIADQFCRDDAGGNPVRPGDFGPNISKRVGARAGAWAFGGGCGPSVIQCARSLIPNPWTAGFR